MEGVTTRDLTRIMNKEIDYVDLMRLALQYSDAVVLADSDLPKELQQFIKQEQKPSLSRLTEADYGQCLNFFKGMTE